MNITLYIQRRQDLYLVNIHYSKAELTIQIIPRKKKYWKYFLFQILRLTTSHVNFTLVLNSTFLGLQKL